MAVVKIEVEVAKEFSEVLKLVAEIIKDVRAGKTTGQITSENLPLLIQAIEGADQVSSEFTESQQAFLNASGLSGAEIVGAFLVESPKIS